MEKTVKRILGCTLALFFLLGTVPTYAFSFFETKKEEETVSTPYVGEEFYLTTKDGIPTKIQQSNGKIADPIPLDSILYINIEGAKRSYEVSGYRSFINWDDESYHIYPSIEYKEMFDTDGVTSLGYKFVVAFVFNQLGLNDEWTTFEGEIYIAPKVGNTAPSQSFSFIVEQTNLPSSPQFYYYNANNPLFKASDLTGNVGVQFGNSASLYFDSNSLWDVNLTFSTAPMDALLRQYPEAELSFLHFTYSPIFNTRYQLIIPATDESYLYRIIGNELIFLDAPFNHDINAFEYSSLTLGKYVISDRALEDTTILSLKDNPLTGIYI